MIYLPLDKLMERNRDNDSNTITVRPPANAETDTGRPRNAPAGGTLMGSRILPLLILTLAVLLVISTSCFVVREQELALRVQLSRIVAIGLRPRFALQDSVRRGRGQVRQAGAHASSSTASSS